MNKQVSTIGLWLIISAFVFSCQTDEDNSHGSVVIGVQGAALSLDDIVRLTVTVSGPSINPNIVSELIEDPANSWSGTIDNIPAGDNRTFLAEAFDASDTLVYSGSAENVTIADGVTTQVNIYLQQVDPPEPFANAVPKFDSLVLSDSQVAPTNEVAIAATASDPDGEPLVYAWTATCGTFSDAAASNTTWTAPETTGACTLTISATDPHTASATLSFDIDVQTQYGNGSANVLVNVNTWPEVQNLVPNPTRIEVGQSTTLDLSATDPDGDTLSFAWTASCTGTFDNAGVEDPTFTLTADNGGAPCTLSVTVTDSRSGTNAANIAVETGAPIDIEDNSTMTVLDCGVPTGNITNPGTLNQEAKDYLLCQHNEVRSKLALGQIQGNSDMLPLATNMQRLAWEDDLAIVASNWAATCNWGHNPNRNDEYTTLVGGSSTLSVGENLYVTSLDPSIFDNPSGITGAVPAWESQGSDWSYGTGATGSCSNECSNFTQVIWAETTMVGCGYAYCPDGLTDPNFSWGKTIVVCNYRTQGNTGAAPYIQGTEYADVCTDDIQPGDTCQNGLITH